MPENNREVTKDVSLVEMAVNVLSLSNPRKLYCLFGTLGRSVSRKHLEIFSHFPQET